MKLIFHGGVKEVGRQCIELVTKKARFLLDAGVKLSDEAEYPLEIKNLRKIDAGITTHAHLDHCGAWPYLQKKGLRCPVYMTPVTRDIVKVLLKDFFKIESLTHIPAYNKENIFAAFQLFKTKEYNKPFEIKDCYFNLFDAGHIPGSANILAESENKRILYTGDIKFNETRLLKGAYFDIKDIDALIIEGTYGNREQTDRKKLEIMFLNKVKEVLNRGGNVLVPAFSVGRTQELLLLLHTQKWNVPVFLDGMGEDMTNIIVEHNASKNPDELRKAKAKTTFITNRIDRERAMKRQGIFVASAGMLTGGHIIEYIKENHQNQKNAILITGYVARGTNGRMLLDEGELFIEGRKTRVKAEHMQFDFSAHASLTELDRLIQKINPKKVIIVHGDSDALKNFADMQRKKAREVYVPELGSEINI